MQPACGDKTDCLGKEDLSAFGALPRPAMTLLMFEFAQINDMILVVIFACCRLLWGSYLTFVFFRDVWTALHAPKPSWTEYNYSPSERPLILEHQAPWWLAATFMVSNAIVMSLSVYWFTRMTAAIQKHVATPNNKYRKSN